MSSLSALSTAHNIHPQKNIKNTLQVQIPNTIQKPSHYPIPKLSLNNGNKKVLRRKKRMSSFISDFLQASITIEASFIMIFFLFMAALFLNFFAIMNMSIQMQSNLEKVLGEVTRQASLLESTDQIPSLLSKLMVRSQINTSVDHFGVQIKSLNVEHDDAWVDASLVYTVSAPVGFSDLGNITLVQRCRKRTFSGETFQGDGEKDSNDEDNTIVYITETGAVYHYFLDCTHLRLSIESVPADSLEARRSSSGGIYHPCEDCASGTAISQSFYYITDYGSRYHTSLACSGLKRTIKEVYLSQVTGMRGCQKCSARK